MSEAVAPPVAPAVAFSAGPDRTGSMIPARGASAVRIWLLVVAVMVYAMILVGGATRLTDSGLSITEWRPLLGAIPPMNDADWALAFEKYRTMTAQAAYMNPDMDMAGFRSIYWWEWGHRQLGRTIGMVFGLPLIAFLVLRWVPRALLPHLLALFALGGLQGLIGWWMVASGVNSDLVSVAPYRLMTHFSLALLIIAYCVWLWLELGGRPKPASAAAHRWAAGLLALVGVQMALGALVAGLDAGRGYTDWPLMAGRVVPETIWALDPWWSNIFENPATTQFLHRVTAYLLIGLSIYAAWRFRADRSFGFGVLAALMSCQAVLGVVTLVNAAPINLALAHQGLGTLGLIAAVYAFWRTRVRQAA